jgi:hypothetical protein
MTYLTRTEVACVALVILLIVGVFVLNVLLNVLHVIGRI